MGDVQNGVRLQDMTAAEYDSFRRRAVADGDTAVGTLWIAERGEGAGRFASIYEIHAAESLRGRGYGEAIKLNVHAHNAAARSLYAKLGYGEATILMTKRLT